MHKKEFFNVSSTNTAELLDLKFYANSLEIATVHE